MKDRVSTANTTLAAQTQSYSPTFFADSAPTSLRSARLMLGHLFDFYRPRSVIDVGCGPGAWLAAAEELGATSLEGIDGPWVQPSTLLSKRIHFRPTDLASDFVTTGGRDLCISVEVAEHIAPEAAGRFVKSLCTLSDVVVFSAAIRLQGGVMHVNEQPQSYWARHFAEHDYECFDFFRPLFWSEHLIDPWYRQNVLLYIRKLHPLATALRARGPVVGPLDTVHPEIYEGNLNRYKRAVDEPTLRFCLLSFGRWFRRKVLSTNVSR